MVSHAAIQRSISFTNSDVQVGEVVVDSVTYSTLSINGWTQTAGYNDYLVPVKYLSFSVPYNAENITVNASSVSTYFDVTLPHSLAKETYATADGRVAPNAVNPGVILRPVDLVKIESVGFIGGNNKVVTIRISPTMVDSAQNKVRFF